MTKKTPTGRTLSLPEPQAIHGSAGRTPSAMISTDLSHAEERIVAYMGGTANVRKAHNVGFKNREGTINGARPVTFEEACSRYVHRFTLDHVPAWASKPCARSGKYPGPHYGSDLEWYKNSEFPDRGGRKRYCRSLRQTYPLGKWLDKPFTNMKVSKEAAGVDLPVIGPDGVSLVFPPKKPYPRAVKRAETKRAKRLAQFEITAINPVMQAIRDHQPEPKKAKAVPTLAEMLERDVNRKGSKKPPKGKTKKQRKPERKK